jgi:hypothetical protein
VIRSRYCIALLGSAALALLTLGSPRDGLLDVSNAQFR